MTTKQLDQRIKLYTLALRCGQITPQEFEGFLQALAKLANPTR